MKAIFQECDSGPLGRGLCAARPIAAGEHILDFEGPIVTFQETLAKGEAESDPLQVGPDRYIDIIEPGRLVNHSCEPNAGIVDDTKLAAIRPIAAGEEIFYDYSTTMDEDHWTLTCLLGEANCRGVVRDFKTLPPDRRQHYLAQGIVQRFIAEQYLPGTGDLA